jgi:hypothetical protein
MAGFIKPEFAALEPRETEVRPNDVRIESDRLRNRRPARIRRRLATHALSFRQSRANCLDEAILGG